MPVGNVLVCDARRHVEHDDTALAVDVVTITETTELLLAGSVPDIELDGSEVLCLSVSKMPWAVSDPETYRCETERVDLYTEGSDVLLFEFTSEMALYESGLDKKADVSRGFCDSRRPVTLGVYGGAT